MTARTFGLALTGAALAASLFATGASAADLKLMTGPQGGSWYPLGGAIQAIVERSVPGTSVQVLPGAGIANVKAIEAGKVDFGFANSVSTVDAINGNPPFETAAKDVCNVATLYPQYFQVVALADGNFGSPADFRGHSGAIQPKGNTAEAITEHMLKAYGMGYDDLSRANYGSYTDSVSLMKDGNADFFTLGTTVPAGAIMDLASARAIKIVPISDEGLAAMQQLNPGYRRIMIPANSYPGQTEEVPTIGYATHVITRCSEDEETVYQVIKNIAANLGDLAAIAKAMQGITPADMAKDVGVPLHKGAERFYREQGAL